MKIILTFTLMMIPGVVSSISVTGYSGGGVTITCKYDKGYTANKKYFCKGQWSECTDQIKTDKKNKWVHSGRFSLYDNTRSAVFTVTIRDLRELDSDTYYCGTDISAKKDSYTEVNLKVIRGQQIRTVRGYSGGNIIINYKYEMKHKNHEKYFCKTAADQCFTVINSNRAAEWKQDRRFSVHDDRSAGLLRVFIRELNENDSGEYKITVKVSEDYSFFSEFNLDIRDETTSSSSSSSSTTSTTTSSSSSSSSPPSSSPPSSSSSSSLSSSSPPPSSSSSASSFSSVRPSPFTGSSLIIPLVLVLLVLIVVGLLLLYIFNKHQSQGGDLSSQTGPEKHEVVSHTGCDYEEIKDTHKQLPTSPSDSSATVEKATGDSQRCITSAEDLNYAVVNFHKKSDCPDSVSIRNNQDYSEYTAVNYLTA
ncbi:CMRF35-like molecule 8 isoform X13 [Ctenopharyngodon idella]|uniref:CMRF35-like molecule 8 isoform X13 n=1 Tax=Ctenopharyngodon idella TaxID=7959 RepID=UPI0022322475|nr:CMRF35-like molecule 8 isoform X13 [Ctenopharyngodon idella]